MGLKPAPFAYAKARSVAHAIELLATDDARLLAGGQSLIATLNMRLSQPALLVDINGISGLDQIALKNGDVEIGALVRHAQAERFAEFARRHGDYAMVGLAACAQADGKRLKNLRLAFFGVAATPVRARSAETALAEGDVEAAVSALDADLEPSDDMHASSEVKSHL